MERLFRDGAQAASLAAGQVATGVPGLTSGLASSVAPCPGATSASCSCSPRSGARRSSSSRSASTSSSRPSSSSGGSSSARWCSFRSLVGRGGLGVLRGHVRTLVLLGALNNALPFWLLGFAETRIDSGLTAVIQAAAPIFTVVLAAWIDPSQRVRGTRLVGIGVGFLGVALLVGVQEGGELVGALAVIGTAACYAVSVLFAGRTVRSLPPLQVSIGQLAAGALIIAPFGLAQAAVRAAVGRGDRRGRRARRARVGHRVPPLLRADRERRRVAGDPRHLPRAGIRARLRRRPARRARHGVVARRPRADPRRHRARDRGAGAPVGSVAS